MIFVKKKNERNNDRDRRFNRQINKQNSRQNDNRQNDYSSFDDVFVFYFFYYSSSSYYANQNSIYNNQRYQYRDFDRLSNVKNQSQFAFIFTQQLFVDRQFLWFTVENASNSKNQNTSKQNVEKFENNDDNQQRDDKVKTYVVDEKNEKKLIEKVFFQQDEEHDDYHAKNENLKYYDQNYYSNDEMSINFTSFVVVMTFQFRCRRCRKTFSFNNVLHRHLREKCSIIVVVYSIVVFTIDVTKVISVSNYQSFTIFDILNSNVIIIRFNIDFAFDLDIDYDFRDWNYIKTEVFLSTKIKSANVCIDIDVDVTFENRNFYKQQIFDDEIRIMITSLKIRELNIQQHESFEYAICDIHIRNMKNDKSITFVLRRKIHLIDNFKINMFIDNDVIDVEKIIINSVKRKIFIINIDVIVSIKVKSSKTSIQRLVHIRKTTVISSLTKMIVFIHYSFLSTNKDFLFEFVDDINLTLFAYIIDTFIFAVMIRNDESQTIKIFRNFRLKRINELKYINAFQIHAENVEEMKSLTIKEFKFTHKFEWFKKFIVVCVIVYATTSVIKIEKVNFNDLIEIVMSFELSSSSSIVINFFLSQTSSTDKSNELVFFNEVTIH